MGERRKSGNRTCITWFIISLTAVLLLTLSGLNLYAKTKTYKNAFDDFENIEKENKKSTADNYFTRFLTDFVNGINIEFQSSYIYYPNDVKYSSKKEEDYKDTKNNFIEEKLFYKTKVVRDNFIFVTEGWFQLGTQEDTYFGVTDSPDEHEMRRRIHEINELYVLWKKPVFDLTIGKKVFKNGICPMFSPADRISPMDWNDPFSPEQLGVSIVKLDFFPRYVDITGAYLPWFTPSKYPSYTSRWIPPANMIAKARASFERHSAESEYTGEYPSALHDPQFFGRLKTSKVVKGWDIFVSCFYGTSPYPVLRIEDKRVDDATATENENDNAGASEEDTRIDEPATTLTHVQEYIKVVNVAGGFSTTHNIFEFHAEALYQVSESYTTPQGENMKKDDDYVNYLAGITINFSDWTSRFSLSEFRWTIDYTDEVITKLKGAGDNYVSSREVRSWFHGIVSHIMFELPLIHNFQVKPHYTCIFKPKDQSWFHDFGFDVNLVDRLDLNVKYQIFTGEKGSDFQEWWGDNDRLIVEAVYRFDTKK